MVTIRCKMEGSSSVEVADKVRAMYTGIVYQHVRPIKEGLYRVTLTLKEESDTVSFSTGGWDASSRASHSSLMAPTTPTGVESWSDIWRDFSSFC